jgi:uncharacterized membrane protein YhaH (DUF805 family)
MEWMLMPLRRYAEFSGRSRRKEYWMYILFLVIVGVIIAVVEQVLGLTDLVAGNGPITTVFSLATLIPSIAVGVRRLHDTDRSGWWMLLPGPGYIAMIAAAVSMNLSMMMMAGALAAICGLVLLVFFLLEGTKGPNRFGDDPKGVNHSEVFA